MSNRTENSNAESVSSSAGCAQADSQFASAPWEPDHQSEKPGYIHIWGSDGDSVATVRGNAAHLESAVDRANLIAAAPELLEALKVAREALKHPHSPIVPMPKVEAAIAKAEGEA
jgi:hypothetical protein